MLKRVYVKITNICNLDCTFCPGTKRAPRMMSAAEFELIADRLRGHTQFVYLHVLGEPLLNPELCEMLRAAQRRSLRTVITTNGTLLRERGGEMLACPGLHRVNISLQSFEGNGMTGGLEDYLSACAGFARDASREGVFCSLRLWNGGGADSRNGEIARLLHEHFPGQWRECDRNVMLAPGVFLETAEEFEWPDMSARDGGDSVFCHGVRSQLGILCDGTVTPCCLDHEGDIVLGNIFNEGIDEILASPRAAAMRRGFERRLASEELCRRCGYARRF